MPTLMPTQRAIQSDPRELMTRAQAGDATAFAAIYQRYLDVIYKFIYARTGNHALTEDLTSETFLRALRALGSFQWQDRDPVAWLFTIARNLVTDHFKSSRHRLEFSTADMRDAESPDENVDADPLTAALRRLTRRAVLTEVARLSPEQRECVILRFLLGMSVAEAAAVMGKEPGAIKSLQYRALRTLARRLPGRDA